MKTPLSIWTVTVLMLAAATASSANPLTEEFHAYLFPDTNCVQLDSLATVHFAVDETAQQFNGYEVTIEFDPEMLTFESLEEGDLMVDACPNRFEYLTMTDSTVTYSHVLLCEGVAIDGPGILSTYYLRTNVPGTTPMEIISDPDRTFVDAGLWVWPNHPTYPRQVIFHNGSVEICDPTSDVEEDGNEARSGGSRIEIRPNPIRDGATLRLGSSEPALSDVSIYDTSGRLVRRLLERSLRTAPGAIHWDRRTDAGRRVGSGVYYVVIRSGADEARRKVVLID
ncbi:MAG: T9SS type A sorting domain-containing protein [Candidatus Eisenbacteria bacterium]|nr:T9SS type A sorting domain-containing protein [Candidatus Latescibacterota bacterium]MBD3302938.1 T9SS type A sorting domain-containing protein [Candidatus Eisenbacteria bacterium]